MRGPFRIPVRATVVAVAAMTLLAACGSSTAKSSAGSNSGTTSTTSSGSGSTTATTVKSFSGSGSGDFCTLVRGTADKVTNPTLPTNPSDWKSIFQEVQKSLDEAKSKAPDEIKGDIQTIANAYQQLVTAVDNAHGNLAQVGSTLGTTFSSADFKTAVTHLEQYMTNVCKLPLPTTPST
jgi:hypothetical protein